MRIARNSGHLVKLGVIALLLSAPAQSVSAGALDDVIAGAKKEGRVSLYESQQPKAWTKIMAVFQKRYPFIKSYEQERLVAGKMVTRVINEAKAGIWNADTVASGTVQMGNLAARDLLQPVDWKALGIPEKSVFDRYTSVGNLFAYVIGYNTDLVKGADIPKKWEDVLNPKWKGKGSWWFYPQPWATLAGVWGEGKAVSFLDKFLAQNWRSSRSTATVSTSLPVNVSETIVPSNTLTPDDGKSSLTLDIGICSGRIIRNPSLGAVRSRAPVVICPIAVLTVAVAPSAATTSPGSRLL